MEQWEQEKRDREIIQELYYDKLDFCGCGNPEDTLHFIKEILNLIKDKHKEDMGYDEYQDKLHGAFQFKDNSKPKLKFTDTQNGIVQFVFYYLDSAGLLEHGSSIGGAWLSTEGKNTLEILNRYDDMELFFY